MTIAKVAAWVIVLSGTVATAAILAEAHDSTSENAAQATTVRRAQPASRIAAGRGRLGVSIRELNDEDVKTARLSAPAGAVIEEVSEGSPAADGGMRKGDIIVEFDGERVRSARQLTRLVRETADGRPVTAVVVRDGQRVTLTVSPLEGSGAVFENLHDLAEWGRTFRFDVPVPVPAVPPAPPAPRARTRPPSVRGFDDLFSRGGGRLGITVDDLSPQLAEYFGTKEGVLVTSVQDNSVGAKAGVRAGDVITSVNGSAVDDPAELRRRVQGLKDGEEFTIAVMRDKKPQTVKGKIDKTPTGRRTYRSIV